MDKEKPAYRRVADDAKDGMNKLKEQS